MIYAKMIKIDDASFRQAPSIARYHHGKNDRSNCDSSHYKTFHRHAEKNI